MNIQYNSKTYLSETILNEIETLIQNKTLDVIQNVYNNTSSGLFFIRRGDILNKKTLYLSFPSNTLLNINNNFKVLLIKTDENNEIGYTRKNPYDYFYILYKGKTDYLFIKKRENNVTLDRNISKIILPFDFGTVNYINDNDDYYQYINAYTNENVLPAYREHAWIVNEFLTMKKIDYIERGVNFLGKYYYKPNGWVQGEDWLKLNSLKDMSDDKNMRNISYIDLNRWVNNINLINFDNLDNMTIWNTTFTQINWNENSNEEWEDF